MPHVARRVYEQLPNCKLIILLRNPVDRAFSQYTHNIKNGKVSEGFEELVHRAKKEYPAQFKRMQEDESYEAEIPLSLLFRGIYVEQIKEWLKYFPLEKILILKSEDLFSKTHEIYQEVLSFLELPPYDLESYVTFNKGLYEKLGVEMSPEIRQELIEYFKPHNEALYEFLGRDFGWK